MARAAVSAPVLSLLAAAAALVFDVAARELVAGDDEATCGRSCRASIIDLHVHLGHAPGANEDSSPKHVFD